MPGSSPPPPPEDAAPPVPVIVHLSGSRRGTTQRLRGETLRIGAAPEVEVRVSPEPSVAPLHATLHRRGMSYELEAEPERPVWVNGERAEHRLLDSGDVLEIGRDGPILRFRLYPAGTGGVKSVAEAFSDCVDCARLGTQNPAGRAALLVTGGVRELATQTALWLRVLLVVLVALLVVSTAYLARRSARLETRLTRQVEGIAALLEQVEGRSIRPEHVAALEGELESAVGRVEALEARSVAPARVVAAASRSVVFLQGAYGFVDPESGEPLRLMSMSEDGAPLRDPRGEPLVGLGGDGPVLEAQFTGTGFVATEDGVLLTNRHMAEPWRYDAPARSVIEQGFRPVMRRFVGYLPGSAEAFEVELVLSSGTGDLAALRCLGLAGKRPPLPLAAAPAEVGDEILVLGYPAGIRALLARADQRFLQTLMREEGLDFWTVARRLAEAGHIAPLASRGIVAQVNPAAVVYDAETTRGGSGGPVLDLEGRVVAVTSAIVSEFGGSNIGVPAALGRHLLQRVAFGDPFLPPGD